MKKLVLILILALTPVPVWAQPICNTYRQVAVELGCSPSNYLLRFGEKYCITFLRENGRFSPAGQSFLKNVRHCLVNKLVHDFGQHRLTCSNVEKIAIDRHVQCYAESGFCTMSGSDKVQLFRLIWREIFQTNIVQMAIKMNSACLEKTSRRSVAFGD